MLTLPPTYQCITMKCFHFSSVDAKNRTDDTSDDDGSASIFGSRPSRISRGRSLSTASSRKLSFDSSSDPDPFSRYGCGLRAFGFAELRAATRGFSRALVIGEGGFGCVYRGVVDGDREGAGGRGSKIDVAVKQLNRNGLQGHKEWITEVKFLGIVRHPNLVKLIGYCAEDDERGIQRLLVYELMSNKSLEDHLLAKVRTPLSWALRLRIAQDAARGLAYLHEEMNFQLIFRDFKTSNVLLDDNFNAKLSDFGLARQGPAEGFSHVSTSVVGTVGYTAPEYIQSGRLTTKSDVWSFGVVLYELITGRRSMDRNLPRSEQKLLDWVKPYATDSKKMCMLIDRRLEDHYCVKSARKFIALANKCLTKQPKNRPRMSEVVEMLGEIIEMSNEKKPDPIARVHSINGVVREEADASNEGGSFRKRVFDFRELVSLRNRSVGRPDWKILPSGLTKTWIV